MRFAGFRVEGLGFYEVCGGLHTHTRLLDLLRMSVSECVKRVCEESALFVGTQQLQSVCEERALFVRTLFHCLLVDCVCGFSFRLCLWFLFQTVFDGTLAELLGLRATCVLRMRCLLW